MHATEIPVTSCYESLRAVSTLDYSIPTGTSIPSELWIKDSSIFPMI